MFAGDVDSDVEGDGARPSSRPNFVVDTRVLGKPDQFDGDLAKWPDWSFVMSSYVHCVSAELGGLLRFAGDHPDPIPMARLPPANQQYSNQLFHMLVLLCRGDKS